MLTLFVLFLAEGICASIRKERWFHACLFCCYRNTLIWFCRWLRSGGKRVLDDKGRQELSERTQEVSLFWYGEKGEGTFRRPKANALRGFEPRPLSFALRRSSSPLTVRFYFFIDTSLFQCSNGFYKMKNKGKEVDIERKYRLLFVGTLEQIKKVLLRFVDMCLQTSYSWHWI